MQIHMIAKEFSITPALRSYLERRLNAGFSAIKVRVREIAIRLRDLNGPRGGRDMMCQISVSIPGGPEVVIKEVQEDIYTAIDLAVKKAAYRVTRILGRQRMAVRGLLSSAKNKSARKLALSAESSSVPGSES